MRMLRFYDQGDAGADPLDGLFDNAINSAVEGDDGEVISNYLAGKDGGEKDEQPEAEVETESEEVVEETPAEEVEEEVEQEGSEEPGEAEEEEAEPEVDPKDTKILALQAMLEKLSGDGELLPDEQKAVEEAKTTPQQAQQSQQADALPLLNFVGDEEQFGQMIQSPVAFNNALNSVLNQSAQFFMQNAARIVTPMVDAKLERGFAIQEFFGGHEDLAPYRGTVLRLAGALQQKNPNIKLTDLLSKLAPLARTSLGLESVASAKPVARHPSRVKPGVTKRATAAKPKVKKPGYSIEDEIESVMKADRLQMEEE